MSDCLQNEDSIVSDLSLSNSDALTGILDSGNNVNSEIFIEETMVSSVSDGYSTDSNLGDDGSLYSELGSGSGGGVKYTGQETDSIIVTVDNNVYTISASLKPIKFDSVADFPLVGSEKLIYIDFSNKVLYGWDSKKEVYYKLVADVKIPTKLSEFTNDTGFITNTVNNLVEYYKKTETYTQTEIDSKISSIPKFAIKVVAELPTTDISETTVYLVASEGDNQNLYVEYIYVGGTWEKLGEQTLDLSNYPNIDQMNTTISNALANYVPNTRKINGKVLSSDIDLTADDVGALSSDTPLFSGDYNDLSNKPTIPEVNQEAIAFAESERQKSKNLFDFLKYVEVNGSPIFLDNGIKGIVDANTSSRFMAYNLYLEEGTYTISVNCKFTTTETGHYPTIGLKLDGNTDNIIRCSSSYGVDTRYSAEFTVNTAQTIQIVLYMSNSSAKMLIGDIAEFTDILLTTDGSTNYQPYYGEIVHKKDLEDVNFSSEHPIGSYHICKTGSEDPASKFGGNWTQIASNVVLPLGNYAPVGTTDSSVALSSVLSGSAISWTGNVSSSYNVLVKTSGKNTYAFTDLTKANKAISGVDVWLRES